MATIKNYGLQGVGSSIQFGKGGGKLAFNSTDSVFEAKLADASTFTNVRVALQPVSAFDATSKDYVDSMVQGLDVKASCRVLTATAPGTFAGSSWSSAPSVIDGVTLSNGDRVLVNVSPAIAGNGIFVYNSGVLSRAEDANDQGDNSEVRAEVTAGMFTFIEEGSAADCGYVLVTNNAITLNTTPLSFTKFSNAGTFNAGNGIIFTGTGGLTIEADVNSNQMIKTGGLDNKSIEIRGPVTGTVDANKVLTNAGPSSEATWTYVQNLVDASGKNTLQVNSAANAEHLVLTTSTASGSAGIVQISTTNSAQLLINSGSGVTKLVNGGTTISSTGGTNITDTGLTLKSSGVDSITNTGTTITSTGTTSIKDVGFSVTSNGTTNIVNTSGTNISSDQSQVFKSGTDTTIQSGGGITLASGSKDILLNAGAHEVVILGESFDVTVTGAASISAAGGLAVAAPTMTVTTVTTNLNSATTNVNATTALNVTSGPITVTSTGTTTIRDQGFSVSSTGTTSIVNTAGTTISSGGAVTIRDTSTNISSSGTTTIVDTGTTLSSTGATTITNTGTTVNSGAGTMVFKAAEIDLTASGATNISSGGAVTIRDTSTTISSSGTTTIVDTGTTISSSGATTIKDTAFTVSSSGAVSVSGTTNTLSSSGATTVNASTTTLSSSGDTTIKAANTTISSSGSVSITSTGGDMNINTGTNELVVTGHSFDVTVTNGVSIAGQTATVSTSGAVTINDASTTITSTGATTIRDASFDLSSAGGTSIKDGTSVTVSTAGATTVTSATNTLSSSGATTINAANTTISSSGNTTILDANTVISSSGSVSITSAGGDMNINTGSNELVVTGHSFDVNVDTVSMNTNTMNLTATSILTIKDAGTNISSSGTTTIVDTGTTISSSGATNITNTGTTVNSGTYTTVINNGGTTINSGSGDVIVTGKDVFVTVQNGVAINPGTGYVTTTTTDFTNAPTNALTTIGYVNTLISQHSDHIWSSGYGNSTAGACGVFTQQFTSGGNTYGDNGKIEMFAPNPGTGANPQKIVVVQGNSSASADNNGEFTVLTSKSTGTGSGSGATGEVRLEAHNNTDTGNCDIRLVPLGDGQVFIGETGDGIIQADDNHALTVMGGNSDGTTVAGNLVIVGGTGTLTQAAGDTIIKGGTNVAGGTVGKVKIEDAYSKTVVEVETVLASGTAVGGYFTVQNCASASASGPKLSVDGPDTNIDITIAPKGTGLVLLPSSYEALLTSSADPNCMVTKQYVDGLVTSGQTALVKTIVAQFQELNNSGAPLVVGFLPDGCRVIRVRINSDANFASDASGASLVVGSTTVLASGDSDLTDSGTIYEVASNYLNNSGTLQNVTLTVDGSSSATHTGTVLVEYRVAAAGVPYAQD